MVAILKKIGWKNDDETEGLKNGQLNCPAVHSNGARRNSFYNSIPPQNTYMKSHQRQKQGSNFDGFQRAVEKELSNWSVLINNVR